MTDICEIPPVKCSWKKGYFQYHYKFSCGPEIMINEGDTPTKAGFKVCPFCGKELIEADGS